MPWGAEPGLSGWAAFLYDYTFSSLNCSSVSAPIETVLQSLHVKVLPPHPLLGDALELFGSCLSCGGAGKVVEASRHWPGVLSVELA